MHACTLLRHLRKLASCLVCRYNAARAMEKPSELSGDMVPEAGTISSEGRPELEDIQRAFEPRQDAALDNYMSCNNRDQRASGLPVGKRSDAKKGAMHELRRALIGQEDPDKAPQSLPHTAENEGRQDGKETDADVNAEGQMERARQALVTVQREKLRACFLQQACRHFRAAQHTCLLKNVEMRGWCVLPFAPCHHFTIIMAIPSLDAACCLRDSWGSVSPRNAVAAPLKCV
jgi:hypothetical protein